MKTLKIRFTRGDEMTQPGGIILRQKDDGEYVAHHFSRDPGSKTPREFFWGRYHRKLANAEAAFQEKLQRCCGYTSGGSLISEDEIEHELEMELL